MSTFKGQDFVGTFGGFVGAIVYADDITLVGSLGGLTLWAH